MRLKLDKAPEIHSFAEAKEVGFFSVCRGKVVGALTSDGKHFEIRYHGTLLVEIEDHVYDYWYITDGNYPSMNTAAVINKFLPKGWTASFKFNYRRDAEGKVAWGHVRENERVIVTNPSGISHDLSGDVVQIRFCDD